MLDNAVPDDAVPDDAVLDDAVLAVPAVAVTTGGAVVTLAASGPALTARAYPAICRVV